MSSSIQAYLAQHRSWPQVLWLTEKLEKAGYEAVLAGGCVRDALMKRPFHDFDVATSATPDQVEALFEKTVAIGKAFGVIMVVHEGTTIEVATFRRDGDYSDGRRPDKIEYALMKEDAKRRDFTVNALFCKTVNASTVIDFVDGQLDIEKKIIRCVGVPEKRFAEDGLRLLRAVRFAAQLKFTIEPKTWTAIVKQSAGIQRVARERQIEELRKIAAAPQASLGWQLLADSHLLKYVLPRLSDHIEKQPQTWQQALTELRRFEVPPPLAIQLAWMFYRFNVSSSENLVNIELRALKATNSEIESAKHFVTGLKQLCNKETNLAKRLKVFDSMVGPWLVEFWPYASIEGDSVKADLIKQTLARFKTLMDGRGHLPSPLLRGEDLKVLGVKPGAEMGKLLAAAFEQQLELGLNRQELLSWVKRQI